MKFSGKIKSYSSCGKGLSLTFYIDPKDKFNVLKNLENFEKKPLRTEILIDADEYMKEKDKITERQRGQIFALVKEIADHLCETDKEYMRKELQRNFMEKSRSPAFSLSDCDKSIASAFIEHLLRTAFELGVQFVEPPRNVFEENIEVYLRICLEKRVCSICGAIHSDIHHVDAIGMGIDRITYDDSGHEKICLCRVHHAEAHKIGWDTFSEKYHITGIIWNE